MVPQDLKPRLAATCKAYPGLAEKLARLDAVQGAIAMNCYGSAALEGNPNTLAEVQEILAPTFRRQWLETMRDHMANAPPEMH